MDEWVREITRIPFIQQTKSDIRGDKRDRSSLFRPKQEMASPTPNVATQICYENMHGILKYDTIMSFKEEWLSKWVKLTTSNIKVVLLPQQLT